VGEQEESPVPDADLVRAALLGAREPLAELVRRHQRTATALAARVLGSEDLARDAVQEAAVTAMTGLDRLRAADRFGPWFCGIALNVARRWAAQLRAEASYGGGDGGCVRAGDGARGWPGGRAGPDELAELADLGARVRSAIAGLAGGQRDAVFLFYLRGLSHREVAAELGISVAAVKARLHQARAALAPRLAPLADIPIPVTKEATPMTTRTDAPQWVDVSIAGVRRQQGDPGSGEPGESLARKHVIVLDAGEERGRVPIWVGPFEATALALILESVETERPLTYQFAARLLEAAGARATEVRITRLTDGVFYAVVIVDGPGGRGEVDARPSDAITLAALADVPIRVEATVLADVTAAEETGVGVQHRDYPTGTAEIAAETEARMRRQREEWQKHPKTC
jgi:RNA polymerase sigma factor (sigma-70 family)